MMTLKGQMEYRETLARARDPIMITFASEHLKETACEYAEDGKTTTWQSRVAENYVERRTGWDEHRNRENPLTKFSFPSSECGDELNVGLGNVLGKEIKG
ncbi:hypothetical protein ACJ73_09452 [Blastomyces percursus]|uniref:Uncharacterized protein n=1 Tax=Blastomyces percursus TaxID=1658174 RepID=A0A1J9P6X7_9EURO|nr:hypothetical protein ACJ73_09452 [Blastomyces percursus]